MTLHRLYRNDAAAAEINSGATLITFRDVDGEVPNLLLSTHDVRNGYGRGDIKKKRRFSSLSHGMLHLALS